MSLMSRKTPAALGIDIGSAGVKVLEMSTSGKGYRADRAGFEPLPKNAIIEHGINDLERPVKLFAGPLLIQKVRASRRLSLFPKPMSLLGRSTFLPG